MSGYIGTQPIPQATQNREAFTATASQTSFATGGYTPQYLDVYLNGVKLVDGTDFTATNGSDVVLTTGAASGDTLEVVAYTAFEAANVTGATDFTVTGSFTSRGIDDNATSTAMTLDSSGNVLVGKTSLGAATGVELASSGQIAVTRDGAVPAFLRRNNSDGSLIDFNKDGSTVGSIGTFNSYPYIGKGDTNLMMVDAVDAIYPRGTNGASSNGNISLGDTGDRFKDLYLSGGVYLGGTGSANKLDDYETGTWTPTVQGTTTAGTSTYSTREASYVKIGRQVTVTCNTVLTGFSGAAGNAVVTGLPFAAASGFGIATGAFECDNVAFSSGYTTAYVTVFGGQSQVSYRQHGSSRTEAPIDVTQVPAGNWQRFSITYFTDA